MEYFSNKMKTGDQPQHIYYYAIDYIDTMDNVLKHQTNSDFRRFIYTQYCKYYNVS